MLTDQHIREPHRTGWDGALRNALRSGAAASVATTVVLAACGAFERGDACGPINGPSQWLWGTRASRKRGFSVRHTVAGYAIHHAMSIMWATLFEKMAARVSRPSAGGTLAIAAATAAAASIVDFRVVPERFTPGFERRLSRRSLAITYGSFALAMAAAAMVSAGTRPNRRQAGPARGTS